MMTHSSSDKDGSLVRHEQGWYFPRDGHPEQDLGRAYDSSSSDKPPPPHSIGYTANYSNYNGLLHGYYDARTGTHISPSVVHYPHSGAEIGDTTDGQTTINTTNRSRNYRTAPSPRHRTLNNLPSSHSPYPIYANHAMVVHNTDSSWFTPHSQPQSALNEHTSTLSPISLSYDREQEIVLKPSLQRHSSMKPSIQVPADDVDIPFDPQLSVVRESSETNTPVDTVNYDFRNANEYPFTSGWVESQTQPYNSRRSYQGHSNTVRQRAYDPPTRGRGYHTLAPHAEPRGSLYPPHPQAPRHVLERGSSVSSSVNEMRAHQYNRDRLLGTVERVRSTSSRSRRPGSLASLSSEQHSPRVNRYVHSPVPPPYQLTERYPELVSPVYYNNNNNRQHSESIPSPRRPNYHPPRNQSYNATSPHYENLGLLTSTEYRAPAFVRHDTPDPSRITSSANVTSGLGSTWSPSRLDSSIKRSRPSLSSAPTPHEYDISSETSPAALPQFPPSNDRYYGEYTKSRHKNSLPSQHNQWNQGYRQPHNNTHKAAFTDTQRTHLLNIAPSDSVDENYEFDPILIDSEPQDFFHIHEVDPPNREHNSSSQGFPRLSLYAERTTSPASRDAQRFDRLRNEYHSFKERQGSSNRLTLSRLESEIL